MDETGTTTSKKPFLTLPISIVIVGILLAGAIFGGFIYMKKGSDQAGQASPAKFVSVSKDDYILGSKDAPLIIVTYTDLECPYCKVFHQTLQQAYAEYGKTGKVAFVYREMPLASLHSQAKGEAIAAECAGKLGGSDKYWAYVDKVFAATPSNNGLDLTLLPKFAADLGLDQTAFANCLKDTSITKKIDKEIADGAALGAQGTPFPAFIYKGEFKGAIPGALPYNDTTDQKGQPVTGLKTVIDQVLSQPK